MNAIKLKHHLYILYLLCFSFISSAAFAQQFDQNYLAWKNKQQAYDQKLKEKSSSDHYLAKPADVITRSSTTAPINQQNKININTASAQELQTIKGIGAKKAQAIIEYRNQVGRFNTLNDLLKVKGIGVKFIEKNQAQLRL